MEIITPSERTFIADQNGTFISSMDFPMLSYGLLNVKTCGTCNAHKIPNAQDFWFGTPSDSSLKVHIQ